MRGEERRTPPCQHTALLFLGAVNGAVIVQLWAVCVPILCVCVCVCMAFVWSEWAGWHVRRNTCDS